MADNNRPAVVFDSQQCRPSMLARVSQAQLRGSRLSNSVDVRDDFHPPGLAGQATFCCCFFIYFYLFILNQLSQHLPRRPCQICRVGRTMALDDHYEISFSIPQGTLPWQPIFVGLMHRIEFR